MFIFLAIVLDLRREDNLSIKDKMTGPNVSFNYLEILLYQ